MNRAPPRSHQLLAAIRDGNILKAAQRQRAAAKPQTPDQERKSSL